jgi:ABC-type transport system substrate-binding protein
LEAYAVALQEYWRVIGVEAVIELEDDSIFFERFGDTNEWEIVVSGYFAGLNQESHYACDQWPYDNGRNRQRYCNPEVDELILAAQNEIDYTARMEILALYQDVLMTDLPVAPLAFPNVFHVHKPTVHNMHPSILNGAFNMETWWIEE